MTWLVLGLLLASMVGLIVYMRREAPPKPPTDPESAMRAAVELHRINRQLDAAWLKSQQRQGASQLRRDLAEALDDEAL